MLIIDVPTSYPNVTQNITLSGVSYTFKYTYNSRDERLRLSIYRDEELVIAGLKIMENQLLLDNYILSGFPDGDLFCARIRGDSSIPATLGTIGLGREYELIYFTNEEIEEILAS